jgi:hypothetical protein
MRISKAEGLYRHEALGPVKDEIARMRKVEEVLLFTGILLGGGGNIRPALPAAWRTILLGARRSRGRRR